MHVHKNEKGFGIVEVLFSIFFITLVMGGAFLLIQQNISGIGSLTQRTVAIGLAQEGMEAVIAIRNSNYIAKANSIEDPPGTPVEFGHNGLSDGLCPSSGSGCQLECYSGGAFPNCNGRSAPNQDLVEFRLAAAPTPAPLRYDSANARYTQGGAGVVSSFTRVVTVDYAGDEVTVKVTVSWDEKGNPQSVVTETTLFDWLPI